MALDVISVSFLKYELASTIDQAVRCAVDTVLKETARIVGARLAEARDAAAESRRENRSLRERLEVSESELKAVRYYMTAAEKNIKQCLQLNRNRPPSSSSCTVTTAIEELQLSPETRDSSHLKGFRSAAKPVPSVGLCLPTVQQTSDWTRSVTNRRRLRSSRAPESDAVQVRAEEPAEDQFYIAEESVIDKEYKTSAGTVQDFGSVHQEEQDAAGPSTKAPDESCELGRFEFEMAAPAGNVNELSLIQVMDNSEELKQNSVKVEDEAEVHLLDPPPLSLSAPSSISAAQPQIISPPVPSVDTEAPPGLMPPIEFFFDT
ncbi:zinc finger protein [Clarias magur]|uniref:Zinc finger protein n=1 Tax=Clarias magur TaxID=1594786 RepID=A0A8J4TZU3_CLAMG|nr:zinc finger protein [Clarias magur]